MINPYYFSDEIYKKKIGFKINLESLNINHTNLVLTNTPNFPDFGIETSFFIKILKKGYYLR